MPQGTFYGPYEAPGVSCRNTPAVRLSTECGEIGTRVEEAVRYEKTSSVQDRHHAVAACRRCQRGARGVRNHPDRIVHEQRRGRRAIARGTHADSRTGAAPGQRRRDVGGRDDDGTDLEAPLEPAGSGSERAEQGEGGGGELSIHALRLEQGAGQRGGPISRPLARRRTVKSSAVDAPPLHPFERG